jgi:hypothetical protein
VVGIRPFQLLEQNALDHIAYRWQKFIFEILEIGNFMIKAPEDSVSDKGLFFIDDTILLCSHTVEGVSWLSGFF